jgi:hypothetical protein
LLAGHELKVGEYYASIGKENAALPLSLLVEQYPKPTPRSKRRRLPVTRAVRRPRSNPLQQISPQPIEVSPSTPIHADSGR